jgi:DNA-binding NarL/FixJ family response regulator
MVSSRPVEDRVMKSAKVALIIASWENMRESLFVLLRSIPQIDTVHQSEDAPTALAMGPGVQPALVLLDYELTDGELQATLGQLKAAWPQARCVVFLEDERDRRRAKDAGGDVILLKGTRAATILETIERLLSEGDPSLGSPRGGRSKHGNL